MAVCFFVDHGVDWQRSRLPDVIWDGLQQHCDPVVRKMDGWMEQLYKVQMKGKKANDFVVFVISWTVC